MYRTQSETGCYHVVQKGAGDQLLFESSHDYRKYLDYLERSLDEHPCTLFAWCLMSNHTHLLIKADFHALGAFMHQLGQCYAQYFNFEMGHSGPVFKGRFFSEPVLEESHLLSAIRYIHNNPAKAGICSMVDYPWSSYREYIDGALLVRTDLALDLLGGVEGFRRFSNLEDDYVSRLNEDKRELRMSDQLALQVAAQLLEPTAPKDVKTLSKSERDRLLRLLKQSGFGVSQISRLTGIGKSTVSRA